MRYTPTATLLRSVGILALLAGLALAVHSWHLLALAAPFAVHTVWASLSRPRGREEWRRDPQGRVGVDEGRRFPLTVGIDSTSPRVVTVVWQSPERMLFSPWSGTSTQIVTADTPHVVEVAPQRVGRAGVDGLVTALDPSLCWRATRTLETVTLSVRPEAVDMAGPSGVTRPTGISGPHRSAQRGDGIDLADILRFQPGDRLRDINWRVSSRTRELHTTTRRAEKDSEVMCIVDSLMVAAGEPDEPTSLTMTARAVTGLTRHYLGLGDSVGLVDIGGAIPPVPAASGVRQARRIIEALALMRTDLARPERPIPVGRIRPGVLAFFLSPLTDRESVAEILKLREQGIQVVVIDTLPDELGNTGAPPVVGETPWLREAWQAVRVERRATVERLRTAGLPVNAWTGPHSLVDVLWAIERARSAPRRRRGA